MITKVKLDIDITMKITIQRFITPFVITAFCSGLWISVAHSQVTTKGLSTGSNTSRAHVDASIARDSSINKPLDLLNDFYPVIEVVISDHDNVRRRTDFDEEDLKIAVLPALAYRTNFGRHQFYAAYTGVFTFHDDFDQEDSESHNLAANLGLDITQRWDLELFAKIGESFEERGVSGSRSFGQFVLDDDGPDELDYFRYGADLIYGRKSGPLVAVLGFERYESEYKNNFQGDENLFGGRDRVVDSLHLDIDYQFGARTSVFARIEYSDIDYDRNLNLLDSEQEEFVIGLRWKPSTSLSGAIAVGKTDRDFDDPTREDYDDTSYYANLSYMLNPFSIISLNASRVLEEPGDTESDFYESDLIGIGWEHAITPRFTFDVYAKWVDDDYNNGREDEFFDWGVGLDYSFRSWLTAGIFYGEIERESNDLIEDLDYEDSYFGIRLRSDLRGLLKGRSEDTIEPDASYDYPRERN